MTTRNQLPNCFQFHAVFRETWQSKHLTGTAQICLPSGLRTGWFDHISIFTDPELPHFGSHPACQQRRSAGTPHQSARMRKVRTVRNGCISCYLVCIYILYKHIQTYYTNIYKHIIQTYTNILYKHIYYRPTRIEYMSNMYIHTLYRITYIDRLIDR